MKHIKIMNPKNNLLGNSNGKWNFFRKHFRKSNNFITHLNYEIK